MLCDVCIRNICWKNFSIELRLIFDFVDAVKKKQLPAWIREGLNKMEREKQKKLERERLMQERQMRKQEPFKENSPEENLRIAANNPTHVGIHH